MTNLNLKPTQREFLKAFVSKKYKFLLYAGVANTGKSYTVARLIVGLANDFPKSRFAVVRKNLTTARRTIWHTYTKVLDEFAIPYERNLVDSRLTLYTGSVIEFIEADRSKDPDWNKLKGLEVTGFHVEEANELEKDAIAVMMTRMGRWNDNGCPDFIIMTCNPSQGWVKEDFKDRSDSGILTPPYYFVQSFKDEMPSEYRDTMLFLPENERQRYLEGLWDYSDDPSQLIKYEWIKPNLAQPVGQAEFLGIDVARYGDDSTVFAYRQGMQLDKLEVFKHNDTVQTAEMAMLRMNEMNIGYQNVSVDVVGVGGGVVDSLKSKGFHVHSYNGGETARNEITAFPFANLRAESYWTLRDGLLNGTIRMVEDPDLIRELINTRYIIKDKVIHIESKDQIKKRLGYSPDRADAMAIVFTLRSVNDKISTGRAKILEQFTGGLNHNTNTRYGSYARKFGF